MVKKFTKDELKEALAAQEGKALKLLNNQSKLDEFLARMERKLKKVPVAGDKLADVPVMVSLIRDYAAKRYNKAPLGAILAMLGALIYFVFPIDMILDIVPLTGYLDDVAVIGFAMKMVHDDVSEYKEWREAAIKEDIEKIIDKEASVKKERRSVIFDYPDPETDTEGTGFNDYDDPIMQ